MMMLKKIIGGDLNELFGGSMVKNDVLKNGEKIAKSLGSSLKKLSK